VLIIGRSKEFAQGFGKKMMSRSGTLKKLYFARASGKLDTKGVLSLRMGISQKDIRAGTWIAQENGKYDACTLFSTICYCPIENTTLVLCRPLTGRTHQIRVHLEALSCPIVNDVLYNPNDVEEPPLKRVRVEEFNFEKDDLCSDCQKKEKETTKEEFTKNEMLFLHAWMYKQETAPEWKYESGIPEWAKRDLEKMNVNESNVHEIADTLLREEIPEDLQKTESGTDI
jgi:23S rRNA-/tRNA-specific pseudouridylate synthase